MRVGAAEKKSPRAEATAQRAVAGAALDSTPAHHLAHLPAELLEGERFVLWRSELRGGKPTKVPYIAGGGRRKASSTNPATWRSLEVALAAYQAAPSEWSGIGRTFAPEDGITGVDLDDSLANGKPRPWAAEILARFAGAYIETSPSGAGVKLWCCGEWRGDWKKRPWHNGKVEVYDRERYFTLTGRTFGEAPAELADCQEALDWLARHVGGEPKRSRPSSSSVPAPAPAPAGASFDAEAIARTLATAPGSRAAWGGTANADLSSNDFHLCKEALDLCGGDLDRAEEVLWRAPARRPKWSSPRGPVSWLRYTLEAAARNREAGLSNVAKLEAARSGRSRPRSADAEIARFADAIAERLRPPAADPADDLAALSERLQTEVARVVRRGLTLELELADGPRVDFGEVENALSPSKVERAVYVSTGRALDLGSKREWAPFAERLARCAHVVESFSEEEETLQWIAGALRPRPFDLAERPDERKAAYGGRGQWSTSGDRAAWREGGRVCVALESLETQLQINRRLPKGGMPELARRLGRVGFTRKRLSFIYEPEKGGAPEEVRVRAWVAPLDALRGTPVWDAAVVGDPKLDAADSEDETLATSTTSGVRPGSGGYGGRP